jgi:hypothetical protein
MGQPSRSMADRRKGEGEWAELRGEEKERERVCTWAALGRKGEERGAWVGRASGWAEQGRERAGASEPRGLAGPEEERIAGPC